MVGLKMQNIKLTETVERLVQFNFIKYNLNHNQLHHIPSVIIWFGSKDSSLSCSPTHAYKVRTLSRVLLLLGGLDELCIVAGGPPIVRPKICHNSTELSKEVKWQKFSPRKILPEF